MVEKYERLERTELAIAQPIGNPQLRGFDVVRIPQISRDETFTPVIGDKQNRHIYSGGQSSKALESAHLIVRHKHFGTIADSNNISETLESIAQNFEVNDAFNIKGMDARLRDIIIEHNAIREAEMAKRASSLGKILANHAIFVVAADRSELGDYTKSTPDIFAALAVDMTVVRKNDKMCIEPVVESVAGDRGLMPQNFYAIHGLYAPTKQ